MADDRMYLADMSANEYICIAKKLGGWSLGNVDLLDKFLSSRGYDCNITQVQEDDYDIIRDMKNFNEDNHWYEYGVLRKLKINYKCPHCDYEQEGNFDKCPTCGLLFRTPQIVTPKEK